MHLYPEVCVLGESVRSHVDARRPRHLDDAAGLHIVDAGDDESATCSDIERELEECFAQGIEVLPVIPVVRFDVGDDADRAPEAQERTVALIGLGHENVAGTPVGVGAGLVQFPADGEGRLGPAVLGARP